MKKSTLFSSLLIVLLFLITACGDNNDDIYGDTGDSANTSDSADSADTADSANTANSGEDSDNVDSADNDNETDDSSDSADSVDDSSTPIDDGNYVDNDNENGYAAPYGKATLKGDLIYLITNEHDITDEMLLKDAIATGPMGNGSIRPATQGISTEWRFINSSSGSFYLLQQTPYNFSTGGIIQKNPIVTLSIPEKLFGLETLPLGMNDEDKATLLVADADFKTGQVLCIHAIGVGSLTQTETLGIPGDEGRYSFNGIVEIFSPKNIPAYGGDITDYKIKACPAH
ncbi:hypothetical protein KAH37_04865 [bacterium]|nr:hypothetical protein [bacterium]